MANTQRIRRFTNRDEYERTIDDYITLGYKITNRGEFSCAMCKKKKKEKHLLVFLLTGWWTLGLGNLIYALMPSKDDDNVLLKLEEKKEEAK